MALSLTSLSR